MCKSSISHRMCLPLFDNHKILLFGLQKNPTISNFSLSRTETRFPCICSLFYSNLLWAILNSVISSLSVSWTMCEVPWPKSTPLISTYYVCKGSWAFILITHKSMRSEKQIIWVKWQSSYLPCGSLFAESGPLLFFCLLPTLVGTGGSYFFLLSWKTTTKCSSLINLFTFIENF